MIDAISVDLRRRLGAVRDQGPRPTCAAHAVTTVHEFLRGVGTPLSCEYLDYFARPNSTAAGCTFSEVSVALRERGQCTETDCPYLASERGSGWAPPAGVQVFRRHSNQGPLLLDSLATDIENGGVPVLGLRLTPSFYVPAAPWILDPRGPVQGLHAVTAVGLGATKGTRMILIRNSWGSAWGDLGHAWIGEAFLSQHLVAILTLHGEVAP